MRVFKGDIDQATYSRLSQKDHLCIDTETDGLDFRKDKLRLVTICTPERNVYLVHHPSFSDSSWLALLLSDGYSAKIFHHALFDLRFLKAGLGIEVKGPIECTKTLIKMAHPMVKAGLASAIKHFLGVKLRKKADHKKWKNDTLTKNQKEYATEDTLYLYPLLKEIKRTARYGELCRYRDAMLAIRVKAALEVEGYTDLLDYGQDDPETVLENRTWWRTREHTSKNHIFSKGGERCVS